MMLKKKNPHISSLLAALIGLTLAGYIGYLVLAQYRTQVAIQGAALNQLTSDSVRRATAVSYFFSERKDDLRDLAQSRELSAFFENQALGMSMEYGLKASLLMIDDLLDKVLRAKQLAGKPIFEQIAFIDASGALLAATPKAEQPAAAQHWRRFLTPEADGPFITAVKGEREMKIMVSSPCRFKGKYLGEVVAWISLSQVNRYFIEGSGQTAGYPVALVFERSYLNAPAKVKAIIGDNLKIPADIKPLSPYLMRRPGADAAAPGDYAILIPVAETPLSVITFLSLGEMYDLHSPRRMLYTTGGIAVFILVGLFYFQRQNTRNAVLRAHLEETTLREAEVDERNRLLAAEIVERRSTEEALRESEARFRAIVSTVPVVIYKFRHSSDSRSFIFVGEKIRGLAGIGAQEMLDDARAFTRLIHPADREALIRASDLVAANKMAAFSHEFRIVKPDGQVRWILASALPQGAPESDDVWCGCLEDITDRKQADLSLRESRQQLLDIVEFLPDATLVVDREGCVVAWNRAMEVMTGVKAKDMIGRGNYEYALPFYGERKPILIDMALHTRGETEQGLTIMKRDGLVTSSEHLAPNLGPNRYLAATASVLRDSNGQITAAIECIRDTTARIRAEQLVRESEATLRSLMDSMPAGVWWYNEQGEVEYLNSRFVEMFGYQLHEIPTVRELYRRIYPDPALREDIFGARSAVIARARLSGTPLPPQETSVTCRDGSVRRIMVNTQFAMGRTLQILIDITEQEQIHNELLKVQKMESLGVLAGGIAHDFNNILTGIMGYISFARLFIDESHEAGGPLEAAEKASQRAAELAHQLLTFAKGGEPIKKVISVQGLLSEALSLSMRGSNVQVETVIPAVLDEIEADEGQMNQAFNNIVINATHAMSGGGTLTVSGENVVLYGGNRLSLAPGTYVKLIFKDEGCGIPEADLKNIFDPYFTTKSGGTGLGLASTLSIVRRHGGHILVQSEVGVGTAFTLYLPSTGKTPTEGEASKDARPRSHPGDAVLVMDDEQMIRSLSSQILVHLGYQVTTCANGEEAIALYRQAKGKGSPYFAVIMDLTIPGGMGGKEAAQHIVAFDPSAKLIVSSGYSNDLALSDSASYGFCGAVVKPYKVAELAQALEKLRSPA